ncbi:MAG: hypothetical protein JSU66_17820 [Deltaproteobacteria bacterium]|nr:MAG: hypothetical protein JSU66_17820 [Deltaproteobacteria bacterium]
MLSGFNTNVVHRGVMFHVQTEDSGRANPHIITHLYHGGSILASEKRGYAERLSESDLTELVRSLMEDQHKALLARLRNGEFDREIEQRLGPDVFGGAAPGAEPANEEATQSATVRAARGTPDASVAPRFGDGLISDKPLDELVLDYLVENARKRKRPRK